MDYVKLENCPALKPYSFSNNHPVIHLKTSDLTAQFCANNENEFMDIKNKMPDKTKAVIIWNCLFYIIYKFTNDAYLVTKVIDL